MGNNRIGMVFCTLRFLPLISIDASMRLNDWLAETQRWLENKVAELEAEKRRRKK